MIDIKKILEIAGLATPRNIPNRNNQNIPGPAPMPRQDIPQQQNTSLSKCDSLYPWQKNIVDALISGRDYCITASPGAGKTLPIVCYWVNNILNIKVIEKNQSLQGQHLELSNFFQQSQNKKIIWAVPIIQLAININTEFRDRIVELFKQFWFMRNQYNTIMRNPYGIPYDENLFKQTIETILAKNITVLHSGSSFNTSSENNIIIGIYESLTNLFKNYNFARSVKLLVIDECHEFFKRDETDTRFENKMLFLDTAMKAIRGTDCRVALLSGTLNPETAYKLVSYLDNNYGREFDSKNQKTIVQSGSNEATLKVLEYNGLNDVNEQVKIIKDAVMKKDWGVALILFSTRKIQEIAALLIKQLPYIGVNSVQNMATSPFTSTSTGRTGKILNPQRPEPFGPWNINKQDVDTSGIPKTRNIFGPNGEKIGEEYFALKRIGANDIENALLRECVARGFAFMYRGKEEFGGEISSNDKIIIENLFRSRKISAILATDSIGVGVNIDIQKLYLTNITKFGGPGRGQVEIPLSDLSQLLNRVGRSATRIGLIFTPRDNISRTIEALSATPNQFDVSDFNMPNITLVKLKAFINSQKEKLGF